MSANPDISPADLHGTQGAFSLTGTELCSLQYCFESTPEAVRLTLDRVDARLADEDLSDSLRGDLQVVLAEVLNNVVEHAYEFQPDHSIDTKLRVTTAGLSCEIRDTGKPMPGLNPPPGKLPDTTTALEDLPEGGFGWFLIRQITADLTYKRSGAENVLVFLMDMS